MPATWTDPRTWVDLDLVTAADLNEQVRDNLLWLKGRPVAVEQDFDDTVWSAVTSSFTDTGINADITTTGGRVLVVAFGTFASGNTARPIATLYQDGANKGHATYGMAQSSAASKIPFAIVYVTPTAPTAAAHSWKLYVRGTDTSGTTVLYQAHMFAVEIGA